MKFLKDEEFEALKSKADNYDSVVAAVVANGEGITAADVTPEVIASALEKEEVEENSAASDEHVTELEQQVETLNETVGQLTTENKELKEENAELRNLPGAESVATVKPKAEASAELNNDVLEFAKSGKSTAEIAQKALENGFYNPNRLK